MYSFKDVWAKCVKRLGDTFTKVTMTLWISPIVPVKLEKDVAILYFADPVKKDMLEARYGDLIKSTFEEVIGHPVEVIIYSENDKPADLEIDVLEEPEEIDLSEQSDDEAYVFENFIVGGSNEFAHAASVAVAESPAKKYNPLFIYGGSGLGKTHLLYAIKHAISKKYPNYNICFIKCEDFVTELVNAIRTKGTLDFKNKYRKVDVLLVDDIQFIGGKDTAQEEMFHTFNALYEDKKQIVLVSDRPPREIQLLEERLRTRFEGGLMADIQTPDIELRMAIIEEKASSLRITLPDDVIEFIAGKLKSNIRQLEGVVKKIHAYYMLTGVSPNIAIAQTAIKDVLNENEPLPVTIDKVITEVSRYMNISVEDIKGKKRTADIASARQIAMYIMREITSMSLPEIGKEFSDRDHSTVHHAISKVEEDMAKNYAIKDSVNEMIKNIKER